MRTSPAEPAVIAGKHASVPPADTAVRADQLDPAVVDDEKNMRSGPPFDAPAFHNDHFPSSFYPRQSFSRSLTVEERVGDDVIAELRRRGHEVTVAAPWSLGRISAVSRNGGFLYAGANARGMQGYAAGR